MDTLACQLCPPSWLLGQTAVVAPASWCGRPLQRVTRCPCPYLPRESSVGEPFPQSPRPDPWASAQDLIPPLALSQGQFQKPFSHTAKSPRWPPSSQALPGSQDPL